ncbi:MAG: 23S rRNA (guanosine(2251)-2'-O)-methyltransferase RlmB [Thermodesulfobacteriota bacterium]
MTQIIYGRHPVLAALRQGDSPLEEVVIARGTKGHWLIEVRRLARAKGVRLRELDRPALERLAGAAHHQGILARRAAYTYRSEKELLDLVAGLTEPALLVAADGLTDPMNLGNLCRSAYAAGAQGLIIPKDRAAGVTPAVLKAAAGALEFLPLFRVTNLVDCLKRLQEAGLTIIGTESAAEKSIYDVDLTVSLVLIIGSEDKGLRLRVRQQCDLLLSIPMARLEIGSLNAAAAGAVVLFEIRRQRLG